jgi:hypothetical protein
MKYSQPTPINDDKFNTEKAILTLKIVLPLKKIGCILKKTILTANNGTEPEDDEFDVIGSHFTDPALCCCSAPASPELE